MSTETKLVEVEGFGLHTDECARMGWAFLGGDDCSCRAPDPAAALAAKVAAETAAAERRRDYWGWDDACDWRDQDFRRCTRSPGHPGDHGPEKHAR